MKRLCLLLPDVRAAHGVVDGAEPHTPVFPHR